MTNFGLFQDPSTAVRIRVWDLPVRLTHWALAILVVLSWLSAENKWLDWHRAFGYCILTLVLFRTYWGFCGSTTARFASFLYGPATVGRFARRLFSAPASPSVVGHNPVGGWNVLAMLLLLLFQCALGLFAVDVDGIESGPLSHHISFDTGRQIAGLHQAVFHVLQALIGLHILAVFAHLTFKREDLIGPMVTGSRTVADTDLPPLRFTSLRRAALGLAASALLIFGLVKGF